MVVREGWESELKWVDRVGSVAAGRNVVRWRFGLTDLDEWGLYKGVVALWVMVTGRVVSE